MAQVIGLGGIFFHCADPEATKAWYARVLGLRVGQTGGFSFDHGESTVRFGEGAMTIFAPFAAESDYFAPSALPYMFNLMVDDLDAVLAHAADQGVEEVQPRESHSYGAFGWIMDPDGRKVELWQPPAP